MDEIFGKVGGSSLLAIVIPAYKAEYLNDALFSLAEQTEKRFAVYIGDDASPHNLLDIIEPFMHRLQIKYHRYNNNLGSTSIVQQWNRCVDLSNEPWVWLFSDDDLADPDCVAAFYATLEETGGEYDLYRFNTICIDGHGKALRINPPHPLFETSIEYAYHRLSRNRLTFVPEHIFSRKAFLKNHGFIDFPLAWCSDDATWMTFSLESGIYTISGPRIKWRRSSDNISSAQRRSVAKKREALFQFLKWMKNEYYEMQLGKDDEMLALTWKVSRSWFLHQLAVIQMVTGPIATITLAFRMREFWDSSFLRNFIGLTSVSINSIKRLLTRMVHKFYNILPIHD